MSDTNLPLLSTRSCHLPRNCLAWIILATCPSLEGRWCVACSYDIPLRWKGTNWKFGWTLPGLVSRLLLLLLVLDAIVSSWLLMVSPPHVQKKSTAKNWRKQTMTTCFPVPVILRSDPSDQPAWCASMRATSPPQRMKFSSSTVRMTSLANTSLHTLWECLGVSVIWKPTCLAMPCPSHSICVNLYHLGENMRNFIPVLDEHVIRIDKINTYLTPPKG